MLFGCFMADFGPLSRRQPYSPNVNHCLFSIRPEGHQELCNKVGSLSPAEHLVEFKPGTILFIHNTLTHQATLPKYACLNIFLLNVVLNIFEKRGLSQNVTSKFCSRSNQEREQNSLKIITNWATPQQILSINSNNIYGGVSFSL